VHLLFVTPYFPPLTYGGIESHVTTLATCLNPAHPCTIAAPGTGSERAGLHSAIAVHRSPALLPSPRPSADFGQVHRWFDSICEEHDVECIVAHNLHTWVAPEVAEALHAAAARHTIPVVLRVHNFSGPSATARIKALPWAKVLCVSAAAARGLVHAGVAGDRVSVVYPPVDTARFRPAPNTWLRDRFGIPLDRAVVLHASRLVGSTEPLRAKGVPSMLRAVSQVKAADLVLAFPPAAPGLEAALEQSLEDIRGLARTLVMPGRVHLISATHDEMPRIYNGAQVFAMLSELEALGSVYVEAAACGLPVIGTNVGGVREAVEDGVTGLVVFDADAAARALDALVGQTSLRRRLGDAGRARMLRTFAAPVVASTLLNALDGLVDSARNRRLHA
jgi:glycosyltransferase involved in cell wall biosynthesis